MAPTGPEHTADASVRQFQKACRIATSADEETARLTLQQTHDLLASFLGQRRPGLDNAKEVNIEQCGG